MRQQSSAPSVIAHNYETLMGRTAVLSPRETTLFSDRRSCFVLFCYLFIYFQFDAFGGDGGN